MDSVIPILSSRKKPSCELLNREKTRNSDLRISTRTLRHQKNVPAGPKGFYGFSFGARTTARLFGWRTDVRHVLLLTAQTTDNDFCSATRKLVGRSLFLEARNLRAKKVIRFMGFHHGPTQRITSTMALPSAPTFCHKMSL